MKKFSDFGINTLKDRNVFPVPITYITDIINCEIEIIEYESGVKTKYGTDRYVVRIRQDGIESKFFTNAIPIKEALDIIPKTEFPFKTTIKQQKFGGGSGRTFYLT